MSTESPNQLLDDWREDEAAPAIPFPGAKPNAPAIQNMTTALDYSRRGLRLTLFGKDGLQSIDCFNQQSTPLLVGDFAGKTKKGVKLGATRVDVEKVYGKPDGEPAPDNLWYVKRGYRFQFRDNKLVAIQIEQPDPSVDTEFRGSEIIRRPRANK